MAPVPIIETPERTNTPQLEVPFGKFLFKKLRALDVKTIFGVPGDFNLSLLEHLYSVEDLKWCGGCNELNAAYSADGYARITQNLGVVITTFGVGELSAINAISGAFAEYVPVLHIVGTSPMATKSTGENLHHLISNKSLLGGANHHAYENMVGDLSVCVESLNNISSAVDQVDNLINKILTHKRPGYLYVPVDFADQLVKVSSYNTSLAGEYSIAEEALVQQAVDSILRKLYQSTNPMVLGDVLVGRFNLNKELNKFVETTKLPNFSTFMGKSILNEANPFYLGDYIGNESSSVIQRFVAQTDCLLHFGNYYNEINSGHNTLYSNIDSNSIIQLNHEFIKVGNQPLIPVNFDKVVPRLSQIVDITKMMPSVHTAEILSEIKHDAHIIEDVKSPTSISQTDLLKTLQTTIKPNDVIVIETGSVMFGLPDLLLPAKARLVGQHFYLSIGYALPSCVGVMMGLKDMNQDKESRVILIEGDGSAQMTIQEMSSFQHNNLNPLIMLINNNGYTVERVIKGPTRSYNDIKPDWEWTKLFKVFGGEENKIHTCIADNLQNLDSGLKEIQKDEHFSKTKMIEIKLDKMDVPWRFQFMTDKSKTKAAVSTQKLSN